MANLEGVHGTNKSNFDEIRKSGFKAGKGRLGTGVYFWRQGKYVRHLAIAWFAYNRDKGKYGEAVSECVVICVGLGCKDEEYFDLWNHEVKEELARLIGGQSLGPDIGDEQIAELYDLLIEKLETKMGAKFKILQSGVSTPSKARLYPRFLGAPMTFLVRDPGCIMMKEESAEEVSDNELKQYA